MGAGVPNRIRASVATCLQNLLELEWLGMDERGEFAEITMDVVFARQVDVAVLAELPGLEFRHLRDLCGRELEVGQQSCGRQQCFGDFSLRPLLAVVDRRLGDRT